MPSTAPNPDPGRESLATTAPTDWRQVGLCLLLFAVTIITYARVIRHGFINLDDPTYVIQNRMVTDGLTRHGVSWAFTTFYGSNWHPLTWISHMIDCQMFGLKPAGHHAVTLILHATNAVVLFVVLRRLTAQIWPSAFVAALFALHPLHVESVAWIAERKDVLSTFFGLLSLLAYAGYAVRKPSQDGIAAKRSLSYLLSWALFALSLMAKPMLVTLPFVLILLDFWPLGRFYRSGIKSLGHLLAEKIPFFILCFASSVVTVVAQHRGGAVASLELLPFGTRAESVVVTYLVYLRRAFWPSPLSVFHPYQRDWKLMMVIGAGLVLLAMTIGAVQMARKRPYFVTGWFWFLGTLVPVIGLVQVGAQAFADRYTYFPFIGLFIIVAWSAYDINARQPGIGLALRAAALCILGALAAATFVYLACWKNTEMLCRHALKVTQENFVAHGTLGAALLDEGRVPEAKEQFASALEIDPGYYAALFGLGKALLNEGNDEQAASLFRRTLSIAPQHAVAHYLLAGVLAKQDKTDEAIVHYEEAIRINPWFISPRIDLASIFIGRRQAEGAMTNALAALNLDPYSADAHFDIAAALLLQGRLKEALPHYEAALNLRPDFAEAHLDYGKALLNLGELVHSETELLRAVQLNRDDVETHRYLAQLYSRQKRPLQQAQEYAQLLRLSPDWPEVLNNLAWMQATHPMAELRSGSEAVALAKRACELTGHTNVWLLSTLAAACAEAGDFPQAVSTQQKVCELAAAITNAPTQQFESRLELYKARKPYHEP